MSKYPNHCVTVGPRPKRVQSSGFSPPGTTAPRRSARASAQARQCAYARLIRGRYAGQRPGLAAAGRNVPTSHLQLCRNGPRPAGALGATPDPHECLLVGQDRANLRRQRRCFGTAASGPHAALHCSTLASSGTGGIRQRICRVQGIALVAKVPAGTRSHLDDHCWTRYNSPVPGVSPIARNQAALLSDPPAQCRRSDRCDPSDT